MFHELFDAPCYTHSPQSTSAFQVGNWGREGIENQGTEEGTGEGRRNVSMRQWVVFASGLTTGRERPGRGLSHHWQQSTWTRVAPSAEPCPSLVPWECLTFSVLGILTGTVRKKWSRLLGQSNMRGPRLSLPRGGGTTFRIFLCGFLILEVGKYLCPRVSSVDEGKWNAYSRRWRWTRVLVDAASPFVPCPASGWVEIFQSTSETVCPFTPADCRFHL